MSMSIADEFVPQGRIVSINKTTALCPVPGVVHYNG